MTTRRRFIAGMAAAPIAAHEFAHQLWAKPGRTSGGGTLFIGTGTKTGSKGIYAASFDAATGTLGTLTLAAETPSPSFLALSPDGRTLFAVSEIDTYKGANTGSLSSYAIEAPSGKLTLINTVASGGAGPCHVNTDHTGRVLLAANYTGGSAASFQIAADGRIGEAVSEFHYESHGLGPGQDKDRQAAPHAHHATPSPDNRFVYINDLGLDRIHIYRLDSATAKLTPSDPPEWVAAPGSGPRVLRFHPNDRWAYCVNELASTVDQLGWDTSTGALTLIGKTKLLPEDTKGISRAAEIIFDAKGRFAYVANRDNDFLVTFSIDPATGNLKSPRRSSCGGKIPRHIALDPRERWILVANQESNWISVFRRDPKTGQLASEGKNFPVQSPQCLVFA